MAIPVTPPWSGNTPGNTLCVINEDGRGRGPVPTSVSTTAGGDGRDAALHVTMATPGGQCIRPWGCRTTTCAPSHSDHVGCSLTVPIHECTSLDSLQIWECLFLASGMDVVRYSTLGLRVVLKIRLMRGNPSRWTHFLANMEI